MKITISPKEVAYDQIKHNEHFKFCNKEYIKIENYYVSEEITVKCALRLSDGYLQQFNNYQLVEKIDKESKDAMVKTIGFGQVFCCKDNYYLRTIRGYENTVFVINLQTGREMTLDEETLVKPIEAELFIKK